MGNERKDLVILAGGYSVKAQDVKQIEGKHIIGINDAYRHMKVDDILSMDENWIKHRIGEVSKLGNKVYLQHDVALNHLMESPTWENLFMFENDRSNNLSDGLMEYNGNNSAMCAMSIAYQKKPKNLYLFGFDCARLHPTETYWYPLYEWAQPSGDTPNELYKLWVDSYERPAELLKERGINVFNVSLNSAIPFFKKISYGEYLNEHAR